MGCFVYGYSFLTELFNTVVPPIPPGPPSRSPPPPQYCRPSSSPKKMFNGKAKILFCHYVAATYLARAPKYRRFLNTAAFSSVPRSTVLGGDDCSCKCTSLQDTPLCFTYSSLRSAAVYPSSTISETSVLPCTRGA